MCFGLIFVFRFFGSFDFLFGCRENAGLDAGFGNMIRSFLLGVIVLESVVILFEFGVVLILLGVFNFEIVAVTFFEVIFVAVSCACIYCGLWNQGRMFSYC